MSNARFSILQARAVSDTQISNAQFRTLAALGSFGDKDGWCFPNLATLGKMLGKTKQAVSKDIQALEDLGYLEVRKQFRPDGSQKNNLYRLIFDTRQRGVDGGKRGVEYPSTSEVDGGSTSEVDALTPQYNDSFNEYYDDEETPKRPNIFAIYEENITQLTPIISDELIELEKDYPAGWVEDAIVEAAKHNARNLAYIKAILKNRQAGKTRPEKSNGNGKKPPAQDAHAKAMEFLDKLEKGEVKL